MLHTLSLEFAVLGMDLNEYDKSKDHIDYKFVRWLAKEKVS
jgi:hypothetical protein